MLFTDPVGWAKSCAGSWLRVFYFAVFHVAMAVYCCSAANDWRLLSMLLLPGVAFPVFYLIALRGVLAQLQRAKGAQSPQSVT